MPSISDSEFEQFQRFIYEAAGISLAENKRALVNGRLANRLAANRLASYGAYLQLLRSGASPQEQQTAVDLMTTNETYFFREPKHFEFLRTLAREAGAGNRMFRAWSAAASTGEEAYSIAMVLEDCLPGRWEVVGTDVSARVLERARRAHYSMERLSNFPSHYLRRFCLKGQGAEEGTLLVTRGLRERVQFHQCNLNATVPKLGTFDVVFLRNVMIYFSRETKRSVVQRVLQTLKPGGFLLIGHSESLFEVSSAVELIAPAIYRKPS
jgi:chemotaxis protein methyltransferase CheR